MYSQIIGEVLHFQHSLIVVRHVVVSVNWWKSNWHQPSTSEQLTMQLLTPPPFVNSSDPASRPDGAAALDRCAGGRRARTARPLHWEAKPGFWSAGETPRGSFPARGGCR